MLFALGRSFFLPPSYSSTVFSVFVQQLLAFLLVALCVSCLIPFVFASALWNGPQHCCRRSWQTCAHPERPLAANLPEKGLALNAWRLAAENCVSRLILQLPAAQPLQHQPGKGPTRAERHKDGTSAQDAQASRRKGRRRLVALVARDRRQCAEIGCLNLKWLRVASSQRSMSKRTKGFPISWPGRSAKTAATNFPCAEYW